MSKQNSVLGEIESLEKLLLNPSYRKAHDFLSKVLADNFREIGRHGAIYDKEEILASIPNESERIIGAQDFVTSSLAPDVWLVNYRTIEGSEEVIRSSIWKKNQGRLQMVFHQGTVVINN